MRLSKRSLAGAAASVVVLSGLSMAAPASADLIDAFGGDCTGASIAEAPAHETNTAPVPVADTATVITNGYVAVDVLANDTDADGDALTLVSSSSSRYGATCVDDNQLVYFANGDEGAPRSGQDKITYAVTDGDSYRTATLTVTYANVVTKAPKVKQRLQIIKGKVTRKAQVTLRNTDPTYTQHVLIGNLNRGDFDKEVVLAPGETKTYTTNQKRLDFITVVSEDSYGALLDGGQINTLTGRVDSGWFIYFGEAREGTKAANAQAWARTARR